MVALETQGIILVRDGALRPVSEGFEFVFLGSSALRAYNRGARKREFRGKGSQERVCPITPMLPSFSRMKAWFPLYSHRG